MPDDVAPDLQLPEHPELREIALALEAAGMAGEILDTRFRVIFTSSEIARVMGVAPEDVHGLSVIRRNTDDETAHIVRTTPESSLEWWQHNAPIMRRYIDPEDSDFEEVFGATSEVAKTVEPADAAPRAWYDLLKFPEEMRFRRFFLGDSNQIMLRLSDDSGEFLGVLWIARGPMPDSLLGRLGRGDRRLFERMDRVFEPARRPAAILFADLEASGALSRRLSSRGYFDLIRELTDLLDSSVIANDGIIGKHAGDGGSALFLAADFGDSESGAARAAVQAAQLIREGAAKLGPDDVDVLINVGLHWGSTLTIGQVATSGRLEVTALGDQMNECARIENAAKSGAILASKDIVERLDAADAGATGLDPDSLAYMPLAEFDGMSEKAIRDAGGIAVTKI